MIHQETLSALAEHAFLQGMSQPLQVAGTIAYVLSFAVGVGPVPAILLSELTSNKIRGACTASCKPHVACQSGFSGRRRCHSRPSAERNDV